MKHRWLFQSCQWSFKSLIVTVKHQKHHEVKKVWKLKSQQSWQMRSDFSGYQWIFMELFQWTCSYFIDFHRITDRQNRTLWNFFSEETHRHLQCRGQASCGIDSIDSAGSLNFEIQIWWKIYQFFQQCPCCDMKAWCASTKLSMFGLSVPSRFDLVGAWHRNFEGFAVDLLEKYLNLLATFTCTAFLCIQRPLGHWNLEIISLSINSCYSFM